VLPLQVVLWEYDNIKYSLEHKCFIESMEKKIKALDTHGNPNLDVVEI
jgi:hypothetical protein